ncbi:hypothetical protein D9611_007932 [Ephemerocybe angulata]|uniref:Uncharacterized protein n=1 Tax=Ephemerocybe angulata TaxID=980116 RepID=A0A8H5CEB4_9AGAR|nr:hypothetical protein D9611_007932 [Tulosesus angulatus]
MVRKKKRSGYSAGTQWIVGGSGHGSDKQGAQMFRHASNFSVQELQATQSGRDTNYHRDIHYHNHYHFCNFAAGAIAGSAVTTIGLFGRPDSTLLPNVC